MRLKPRLNKQFVSVAAVRLEEYKREGRHLAVGYGVHPSPFGGMLLGVTEQRICWLSFVTENGLDEGIAALRSVWPTAQLKEDPESTGDTAASLFDTLHDPRNRLQLFVHGTSFQIDVWKALLRIPSGTTVAYQQVADWVDKPRAVRAVANAVGANPISYLIPCHRVVRSTGECGGYRWGPDRKRTMLDWECAKRECETPISLPLESTNQLEVH